MPQSPEHRQVVQIVEPITGINECCPNWICILSQELCGFQCPQNPSSSPSPSTSIYNTFYRLLSASYSVPLVSTMSSPPASPPPYYYSSPSPDSLYLLLLTAISICLYPTACVALSMPSSRPMHSCKLPHAVFAWSPAALMTSLSRAWRSISTIPTGSTPGRLSSANRQQAISAQ